MRKLEELRNESKELGGSVMLEMTAGSTILEMCTSETITCRKEEFIQKRNELCSQGKYYILIAEPGRETMAQAIAGFLKEKARQERQNQFYKEVLQLHDLKVERQRIEGLINNPTINKLKDILGNLDVCDEDKIYLAKILIKDVKGTNHEERNYILQNVLESLDLAQ